MPTELLEEILQEVRSVSARLAGVENKLDSTETRLTHIENKFKSLDLNFTSIVNKVDKLEQGFLKLDRRFTSLELGQSNLTETAGKIGQTADTINSQTALLSEYNTEINYKLDNITDRIETVEAITKENLYDITKLKMIR